MENIKEIPLNPAANVQIHSKARFVNSLGLPLEQEKEMYELARSSQWTLSEVVEELPAEDLDQPWIDFSVDPRFARMLQTVPEGERLACSLASGESFLRTFLTGEQWAMMTCGQLVAEMPDMQTKKLATLQLQDETRHLESIHWLFENRLPKIEIPSGMEALRHIQLSLGTEGWEVKLSVLMIMEHIARISLESVLACTKSLRVKTILNRISIDEGRHVKIGHELLRNHIADFSKNEKTHLESVLLDVLRNMFPWPQSQMQQAYFSGRETKNITGALVHLMNGQNFGDQVLREFSGIGMNTSALENFFAANLGWKRLEPNADVVT